MINLPRLLSIGAMAAFCVACSSRPSIDKVNEHFANPTGSTSNKTQVIAATGKHDTSETAQRVAGNGSSFGFGLSAVGKFNGLERLQPRTMFSHEISKLRSLAMGIEQSALVSGVEGSDPCVDEDALGRAFTELSAGFLLGGKGSGDFSYTIDLEKCTEGLVTGSMSVDGEIELSKTSFSFYVEQSLTDACETMGIEACVNGEFAIEMSAEGDEMMQTGKLDFVTAWFVDTTWNEQGQRLSAEAKGGIRLAADNEMAELEVLVFVVDANGDEKSFVLTVTANADGTASLTIRGSDGNLNCTVQADGAGECTEFLNGSAVMDGTQLQWSTIEAREVRQSESFGRY